MSLRIEQHGKHWYVLYPWWRRLFSFAPSPFMAGTGVFDESPVPFISRDIAVAAIEKYPNGKLCIDAPFLPPNPMLTESGQKALLPPREAAVVPCGPYGRKFD